MLSRWTFATGLLIAGLALAQGTTRPAGPAASQPAAPNAAASKIVAVTVYQGTALVTREVTIPQGVGLVEVTVTPLPAQTVDSSLYTEGGDGIRVLSTRYRTRAVRDDMRAEVRELEDQIKSKQQEIEQKQKQIETTTQNMQFLAKLENFTGATMQQLTEKGVLNAEATLTLSKYIMDTRAQKADQVVQLQQEIKKITEEISFAQRQLNEVAARTTRAERDAVIVVDKANAAGGTVQLNYLVSAATWRPHYKLRGGNDKDPVQVEYLAAVVQQTGEDWAGVNMVLSTAQPMLSAAPPELMALDVSVTPGGGKPLAAPGENLRRQQDLQRQAQEAFTKNDDAGGWRMNNAAAAEQQTRELLAKDDDLEGIAIAGPSVTYHLKPRFTIPSRNDEQLIEVARLELSPEYFYKAVPVLTPHVYRVANLTNKSELVLLPGEATVYVGKDFVGRMNMPLVAIGEQFTAGFGVDPQLQVERKVVSKSNSVQGGNQVHNYDYRIRISSYKAEPVKMQVWDRLPRAQTSAVAVTFQAAKPDLSKDPTYERVERPDNLLRWDVTVEPGQNGEKAVAITYQFKLEYERNVAVTGFNPSAPSRR